MDEHPDEFVVRMASEEDTAQIARMMTALNEAAGPPIGVPNTPEHWRVSEEQMRRRLEAAAGVERVLLAEVGGQPAGMLGLRIVPYLEEDALYAEVTELIIDRGYRRRGVATALMRAAERAAAALGCRYVHVNAWHTNQDAIAFYRAAGYGAVMLGFERVIDNT